MPVVLLAAVIAIVGQTGPKRVDIDFDAERKVREYLKENARDPAKLAFVAFSKPFAATGCKVFNKEEPKDPWGGELSFGGIAIYAKYKTLNTDNAPVTVTRVFLIGQNGKVFFSVPDNEFHTGSKADPFGKDFVK